MFIFRPIKIANFYVKITLLNVKTNPILGFVAMRLKRAVCQNGWLLGVKSIYRVEYRTMCELLREYRERAGLTQDELADLIADSLGWRASQVGKVERGERRIDVFEVRALCAALGVSMGEFWAELERRLGS
jgi:hypothetical protein